MARFISTSRIEKQTVTGIQVNGEIYFPRLQQYRPRAFGTWAIFPQPREINLTIDLDASHYLCNSRYSKYCIIQDVVGLELGVLLFVLWAAFPSIFAKNSHTADCRTTVSLHFIITYLNCSNTFQFSFSSRRLQLIFRTTLLTVYTVLGYLNTAFCQQTRHTTKQRDRLTRGDII